MRIQHNIAAANSHRQLSSNTGAVSKNLEKLSSGYSINRAGDNAAGLAISEKMRAQITGLDTAQNNANDGISLVQTAEGALTEVHSMLNRMTELATQSANGTYDNDVDRKNLQEEIKSLKSEIDRISESTNYNGINLLDGSLSSSEVTLKSAANGEKEVFIDKGSTSIANANTRIDATKYECQLDSIDTNSATGDTLTIKFNVEGKEHTIKLTDNTAGTAISLANVQKALTGDTGNVLSLDTDAATTEALSVFNQNFTIDNAGKITAKTAGTANTASISSVIATGTMKFTGGGTASTSGLTATSVTSAKDAGYLLDTSAAATAGTLKLGDKSIEITAADTRDTILSKLVDAGVSASAGAANKIFVVEDDAIKAKQTGTGISSSNNSLVATSDNASAATYSITSNAAAGANGANKLTINYVDTDGKEKTKELDYTSTTAGATENNAAIANAIKADDELKDLFDVTSSGTAITLTSRLKGENGAVLKGLSTDDATAGVVGKMDVTKGEDKGTVLSFGKDSTGAAGSFKAGDTIKINGKTYEFTDGTAATGKGNTSVSVGTDVEATFKNLQAALEKDGIASKLTGTGATAKLEIADTAASNKRGEGGLSLQVGDTSESFNKVTVSVDNMNTKSLGIDDIDISTQGGADAAIKKIKDAINTVSTTRGNLGAIQNRLEHTINNLGVAEENMTAAESRIRDVDMAKEMMDYTKNNILVQASQAMLAQANQQPQGVLQLLQ